MLLDVALSEDPRIFVALTLITLCFVQWRSERKENWAYIIMFTAIRTNFSVIHYQTQFRILYNYCIVDYKYTVLTSWHLWFEYKSIIFLMDWLLYHFIPMHTKSGQLQVCIVLRECRNASWNGWNYLNETANIFSYYNTLHNVFLANFSKSEMII